MKSRIKQYIFIAIIVAAVYMILSNHFVFYGKQVRLLKKAEMNLHYTFFSLNQKKPEVIMQNETLREAGIGDILVEFGIIDSDEMNRLYYKTD